jgi:SulP family sulfate permease
MFGFVNGLAIIIFMAQLEQFKTVVDGHLTWLSGSALYTMLGLVALTILIVLGFPRLTKAVPSSLVAIIIVGFIVFLSDRYQNRKRYCFCQRWITPFSYPSSTAYF